MNRSRQSPPTKKASAKASAKSTTKAVAKASAKAKPPRSDPTVPESEVDDDYASTLPPPMKRGAALAQAIDDKAKEKNLQKKEVAAILGVSEPYFTLLQGGDRWYGSVSEDKLRGIAEFLEVPLLSVFMLAEIIRSEDFFRATNIEEQLDSVFNALARDKRFVTIAVAREDWASATLRMRVLCAVLYQGLSNKDILERFKLITLVDPDPQE